MENYNIVDGIMRYEEGEMDLEQTVEFFRALKETGVLYSLQGHYQRMARDLAEAGLL